MISAKEGFLTDSNELSGSQTMVEDQEIEMEQEQQQQESQEGFEEATEQSRGGAADDVNTLAGQAASLTGSISESGLFQSKIKQVASAGALPPMGGDSREYLTEKVFPTLLPAIENLLRTIKKSKLDEESIDPIQWIAEHLKESK